LRNPLDDVAFRRIINTPKRGLGDVALNELAEAARKSGMSMLLCCLMPPDTLSPRVAARIAPFAELMRDLGLAKDDMSPGDFVEKLLADTGLLQHYTADKTEEGAARAENLREFVGAVFEYERANENPRLDDFLDNVGLASDIDTMEETPRSVTMMTLHAAKGLEFSVVFLVGLEEGVFPHSRSLDDFDQMEEERRLCYVGMTRGMEKLYLTRAQRRMLYNRASYNPPARFLDDLPAEVVKTGTMARAMSASAKRTDDWDDDFGFSPQIVSNKPAKLSAKPIAAVKPAVSPVAQQRPAPVLNVGDRVEHAHFGIGTVIAVSDNKATASVDFDGRGIKQLSVSMAPMKVNKGD